MVKMMRTYSLLRDAAKHSMGRLRLHSMIAFLQTPLQLRWRTVFGPESASLHLHWAQ